MHLADTFVSIDPGTPELASYLAVAVSLVLGVVALASLFVSTSERKYEHPRLSMAGAACGLLLLPLLAVASTVASDSIEANEVSQLESATDARYESGTTHEGVVLATADGSRIECREESSRIGEKNFWCGPAER